MFLVAAPSAALPAAPPGPFQVLSSPTMNATDLDLAVAGDGAAVAVWVETDFSNYQLWAAAYSPAAGWGSPGLIDNQSYTIGGVHVALDGAGNATLVWAVYGSPNAIWYSQAPPGGPFGAPVWVHNVSVVLQWQPLLSVSASGRAFFTWVEGSPTGEVYVAVVEAGAPSADVYNLTEPSTSAIVSAVATDATGAGTAVWCSWNGSTANLTFARMPLASLWTAPAVATAGASSDCGTIAAAPTPGGGVSVLFGRRIASNRDIAETHFTPTAGWSAATAVGYVPSGSSVEAVSLSAAADGGILASWTLMTFPMPNPFYSGWTAAFDPAAGWQAAQQITNGTAAFAQVGVAAAPNGFGLALALQAGTYSSGVQIRQHSRGTDCNNWSGPYTAGGTDSGALAVAVGLADSGSGLALWSTYHGAGYELRAAPVHLVTPPGASLTGPLDGAVVDAPVVTVTGTAPPDSTVNAAGVLASADSSGRFSVQVPLSAGANLIPVRVAFAGDWAPCASNLLVNVTYVDPVPGLRAELANATADLTVLSAAVAAAHAQIQALEASGTASRSEIDALRADLDLAQAKLALDEAQISSLSLALNTSASADADTIASLQTQLDLLQLRLNNTANNTNTNAAADRAALDDARASSGFALLLGAVGALLGAAGVVLAITSRRDRPKREPRLDHPAGDAKERKPPGEEE
jgi:hypothetical protein